MLTPVPATDSTRAQWLDVPLDFAPAPRCPCGVCNTDHTCGEDESGRTPPYRSLDGPLVKLWQLYLPAYPLPLRARHRLSRPWDGARPMEAPPRQVVVAHMWSSAMHRFALKRASRTAPQLALHHSALLQWHQVTSHPMVLQDVRTQKLLADVSLSRWEYVTACDFACGTWGLRAYPHPPPPLAIPTGDVHAAADSVERDLARLLWALVAGEATVMPACFAAVHAQLRQMHPVLGFRLAVVFVHASRQRRARIDKAALASVGPALRAHATTWAELRCLTRPARSTAAPTANGAQIESACAVVRAVAAGTRIKGLGRPAACAFVAMAQFPHIRQSVGRQAEQRLQQGLGPLRPANAPLPSAMALGAEIVMAVSVLNGLEAQRTAKGWPHVLVAQLLGQRLGDWARLPEARRFMQARASSPDEHLCDDQPFRWGRSVGVPGDASTRFRIFADLVWRVLRLTLSAPAVCMGGDVANAATSLGLPLFESVMRAFMASAAQGAHRFPDDLQLVRCNGMPTKGVGGNLESHAFTVPARKGEEAQDACCICTDPIVVGARAVRLPACRHCFHSECVGTWLASNNWCPLCRAVVVFESRPPTHARKRTDRPPVLDSDDANTKSTPDSPRRCKRTRH